MDVALIPSASSPFLECALVTVDERVVVDGEPPPAQCSIAAQAAHSLPSVRRTSGRLAHG